MEVIARSKEFGRVGVLMGGPSSEREISLKSGKAVYQAFKAIGLDTVAIDITTDAQSENIALLKSLNLDCAFLALHGRYGEDGQIQEILQMLGIAYTGSGPEASRLAMDKVRTHQVLGEKGMCIPKYQVLRLREYAPKSIADTGFPFPWVIKPAAHGSSIGLSIIDSEKGLPAALELGFSFDDCLLIEEYILGRELTVAIFDREALPVIEIIPKTRFFDFESKYKPGMSEYVVPARLEGPLAQTVRQIGLEAHMHLGCVDLSRVDIILKDDSLPYVLEVNTIPGLTETSLLPKAASHIGIDFTELCLGLISLAYEKKNTAAAARS